MKALGRTALTACAAGLAALLSVGQAAAAPAAPDTLASMCVADGEPSTVCSCASAEFRRTASKDDVTVYSDVGRIYLARLKAARPQRDAWDDAIGAVAIKKRVMPVDLADKASLLRARYKSAIHDCAEATAALPAPEAQKTP